MFSISASGLSWQLPGGKPLFKNLHFHFGIGRTGLVGRNGVGKSTLVELIQGKRKPSEGSLAVRGAIAVIPQNLEAYRQGKVVDVLGMTEPWQAWCRMRDGMATPEDWEILHGHWDLEERITQALAHAGVSRLHPESLCHYFSGGELLHLAIEGAQLRKTDLLILDEPTNHLDASGRAALIASVKEWKGVLLVISHDRELLRVMDQIAELSPSGMRLYGGGYDLYREARQERTRFGHSQNSARGHEAKRRSHLGPSRQGA